MALIPSTHRWRTLGVGACCAAAGVGARAVAHAPPARASPHHRATAAHAVAHRRGAPARVIRRSVRGNAVVRTKTGYTTATWNRGIVTAVTADQITLAEGSVARPYTTVNLTLPADVRVRNNRAKAELSSVTTGERAIVVRLPKRTILIAHSPKQHPRG